jgi:hypothetical protein
MSDSSNPLLAGIRLPGRSFQLPSRGLFYKNGELADNIVDGEIHVRPMSALDEINMKNPDQLFSGGAITEVFMHCVSGVVKPTQLLSKDVDAIMLFLRTVTYGSSYEFVATHGCEGAKEHTYGCDVDEIIGNSRLIDPTTIESQYQVKLSSGQVVKLRPNKYQQLLDMIKQNENKTVMTAEDQQRNLVLLLLGVIESVDGISDPALITEWVREVPTMMINQIGDKIEHLNDWGASLVATCNCKDCGKEFKVDIPVNPVSFFTE